MSAVTKTPILDTLIDSNTNAPVDTTEAPVDTTEAPVEESTLESLTIPNFDIGEDDAFTTKMVSSIITRLFPTKDGIQTGEYFVNNVANFGDKTQHFIMLGANLYKDAIQNIAEDDQDEAVELAYTKFILNSKNIIVELQKQLPAKLAALNWIGTKLFLSFYNKTQFSGLDDKRTPMYGAPTCMFVLKMKPMPNAVPFSKPKKAYIPKTQQAASAPVEPVPVRAVQQVSSMPAPVRAVQQVSSMPAPVPVRAVQQVSSIPVPVRAVQQDSTIPVRKLRNPPHASNGISVYRVEPTSTKPTYRSMILSTPQPEPMSLAGGGGGGGGSHHVENIMAGGGGGGYHVETTVASGGRGYVTGKPRK